VLDAAEAVEILRTYVSQKGLKFTGQRQTVTEVFFDPAFQEHHPTVEELFLRVRERDSRVGYATVYRTLKLLTECGLANPSRLGDKQTRYEPESPGEHHDHMVCNECGAILEFEDEGIENLQEQVASRLGFALEDHKMILFGRPRDDCNVSNCRRDEAGSRP
jgi:Fur family ferric uptake transcriptional regulator